jgi:hypothetical protein
LTSRLKDFIRDSLPLATLDSLATLLIGQQREIERSERWTGWRVLRRRGILQLQLQGAHSHGFGRCLARIPSLEVGALRRVDRDALANGIGRDHGHREGVLERGCGRGAEVARAPVPTRGLLVGCLSASRGASGYPVGRTSRRVGVDRNHRVRRSRH